MEEFFRSDLEKLYQEANKANKQLENIRKADEEIRKIEESNEIPAESKATELAKQQEIKQKSQVALDKIIAKSNDDNQTKSMQTLAEGFKKQFEQYQNNPTCNVPSIPRTPVNPPKTMDEKISELSDKYNDDEIAMVKKIFEIIKKRCPKKHAQIVESIKESVLNDLKK